MTKRLCLRLQLSAKTQQRRNDDDGAGGKGGQPAPTCVTKSSGGSSSCKPAPTWKQYASDDCATTGATLTGYSPDEDCGDGNSSSVKYTCCGPAAPAPVSPAGK
jgi:hypothetical protein